MEKKSLNSHRIKFHQYQQNGQSYLILTHWTKNKHILSRHMTLEIQALALNIHSALKIYYPIWYIQTFLYTPVVF